MRKRPTTYADLLNSRDRSRRYYAKHREAILARARDRRSGADLAHWLERRRALEDFSDPYAELCAVYLLT